MRYLLICLFMFCCSIPVAVDAREIAGVQIAETIEGENGVSLNLNGVGLRNKLFFKIYIAQLYLEKKEKNADKVLASDSQKTMRMYFLYDEVAKDKLVAAWNEGFEGNLSKEQLTKLESRITAFNSMFETAKKGDLVSLDYIPEVGTRVVTNGALKGVIEGKDFADAMFSIWLGKKPVTTELKQSLLGIKG